MAKIVGAMVRVYQVGFGDCFVLRLEYSDKKKRHVLIDFGTTEVPSQKVGGRSKTKGDVQLAVAKDIKSFTGGKLDAVVATHRHADHISGFDPGKKDAGPGAIIRSLKPTVVVQPWTENPKEATTSRGPIASAPAARHSFALALQGMQAVAGAAMTEALAMREGGELGARRAEAIRFLGEDNLSNADAVRNLMVMAAEGSAEYVYAGCKTPRLSKALPGVGIQVLGPPTPRQSKGVEKQRSKDDDEFWQIQGRTLRPARAGGARARGAVPPEARWLAERMRSVRARQLLGLVRALDKAMNNTSVILLLKVGKARLLFPGDAQIENWLYSLKESPEKKKILSELSKVTFYKVGHHGSRNATPKTLWDNFANRGKGKTRGSLQTAMSTMAGKHGSTGEKTEVPRRTLVDELVSHTHLTSTMNPKTRRSVSEPYIDIVLDV